MSRANKPVPTTAGWHKAELIKTIRSISHRNDIWSVFSDFVEMAATSIANACDRLNPQWQEREARHLQIIKRYREDEQKAFPAMLGHLVNALSCGMDDVLGQVYMEMELGNKHTGQFFTPYSLCRVMAAMNVMDMKPRIEERGFVALNEPSCGGGAMLIAMCEELNNHSMNYQQCVHVTAQDLDLKAVHMTYLQLSLLHVPAVVIHGNTLMLEERSRWYTPAHIMGGWEWKLRTTRKPEILPEPEPAPQIVMPPPSNDWQQHSLF